MADTYKTAQPSPDIPNNSTGNTGAINTGTVPGYNSSAVTQPTVQYPDMVPQLQNMVKAPSHPMHPNSWGNKIFQSSQTKPSNTNRQPETLRQIPAGSRGPQMVHPDLKVEIDNGNNGWLNTARTFAGRTVNAIEQGMLGAVNFLGGTVPSLVMSSPGYALQLAGWGYRKLGMDSLGDLYSQLGEKYHKYNYIGNWFQNNIVDPNWAYLDNRDKAYKSEFQWNDDWTDQEKALADGATEATALMITGGAQATGRVAATTIGKGTRTAVNVARKIKGKAPKTIPTPQLKIPTTTKDPTAPVKKFIANAGQERADDLLISPVANKVMSKYLSNNTAQPAGGYPVRQRHANQIPQQGLDMSGMAMMMMPMLMAGYNQQNVNSNQQQQQPGWSHNGISQAMWRS